MNLASLDDAILLFGDLWIALIAVAVYANLWWWFDLTPEEREAYRKQDDPR